MGAFSIVQKSGGNMSKLILRCNYLKNAPASHLSNFINYIGTREGVEKVSSTTGLLPATVKQQELIQDILNKIEDATKLHEYHDYLQKPTRENASEFITQALEYNMDIVAKKKNYMDYLANRPGAEQIGSHGLFSVAGESIVLSKVQEEVGNHQGVIWTNVVSLRREDAERLGYDSAAQWQELIRSRMQLFAENYKIDSTHLKWYAAFHNESHHPHIHLVIYSTDPREGFLTKSGIDRIRSALAHDIFRQDFMSIYERKTEQRDLLKEQAETSLLFLMEQMRKGVCQNGKIEQDMQLLSERLQNTGGKKVYGYLKADVKAIINRIVNELEKEPLVSECYQKWMQCQNEIISAYKDAMPPPIPLSEQKDLKSIKNMIIRHALKLGQEEFYMDDAENTEQEMQTEEQNFIASLEQEESGNEEREIEPLREDELIENIITENVNPQVSNTEATSSLYYADWTDTYKEARDYLYGTEEIEPDLEAAYEIMKEEAEHGNALALHDIGRMYQRGIYVEENEENAQQWYQESLKAFLYAEQQKPKAYLEYRIGKLFQYGSGTEKDLETAAGWFEEACEKEHKYALYSLGMLYYRGEGVEQSYATAHSLFYRSHKKGNAYASFELAKMYEKGIGTAPDTPKAEDCYRIAFLGLLAMEKKSKDDNLLYRIGSMYLHGKGTQADEKKAEKYFLRSAEYGNDHAKYQLAKLYIRQELEKVKQSQKEVQPDHDKITQAVAWLTEAAEKENYFAAYALGKLYADGILLARDTDKAIPYLESASDHENWFAAYRLGKLYLTKEKFNINQAIHYLALAADHENEYAAYRLGKMYLEGVSGPDDFLYDPDKKKADSRKREKPRNLILDKNIELAVNYLTKAADAGNQFAQYAIGKLYLIGKEVEQDKEKAFDYLTRSAEQGNIYAQFFLDHWNDLYHPDLALMATRLMHQLERAFQDQMAGAKGTKGMTESKLRRKIRDKKIAQGHASDDHASIENEQQQYL